jgi:hypothetical protein
MTGSRFGVLIFDLDGTLIDTNNVYRAAFVAPPRNGGTQVLTVAAKQDFISPFETAFDPAAPRRKSPPPRIVKPLRTRSLEPCPRSFVDDPVTCSGAKSLASCA